jgi:cytochrome c oxidase assembly protein subunit 11
VTVPTPKRRPRFDLGLTAAACVVFVAGMVGASFAAVPLYRIFCQVTGFDGTPRQATAAPATIGDRVVTVQFDANIGNGLGWSFRPLQRSVKVKLGEVGHVAFLAENRTPWTITGTAVFNVTPESVGAYFNKLECFCFTEQTLKAGESAELGVTFFVDPAYARDGDLDTTSTITLSYTLFPVVKPAPKPLAALPPALGTGRPGGTTERDQNG